MAIDAVSADRACAADRREAARIAAHKYCLSRAEARRDIRIEEAKAAIAAQPTPAERAAQMRPRLSAQMIDIFV